MRHLFSTLLLLLHFTLSFAQQPPAFLNRKVNGEVVLKNGKTLHGKFQVPGLGTSHINFVSKGEDKQSIPSEDIQYLIAKSDKGHRSILEYTSVGSFKKSKGEITIKETKKKFWLFISVNGKKAKLYVAGTGFKGYDNSELEAVAYGNAQNPASFNYYGKMEGRDAIPVLVDVSSGGITINGNAYFKMYGSLFFRDDEDLKTKIKNKEEGYVSKNREKVFADYNKK